MIYVFFKTWTVWPNFSKFLQNKYLQKIKTRVTVQIWRFPEFFSFSQSQVHSPVTSACKSIIFEIKRRVVKWYYSKVTALFILVSFFPSYYLCRFRNIKNALLSSAECIQCCDTRTTVSDFCRKSELLSQVNINIGEKPQRRGWALCPQTVFLNF